MAFRPGAVEDRPLNRSFWNGRNVFVTGHTGFKGSWFSLWLGQLGANVTGYALDPPTHPNLFEQTDLATTMSSHRGDVRDLDTLSLALAEATPDIVFHFAAQSLVRSSYEDPLETYSTNVLGTATVLEALGTTPSAKVAIMATSDKCYLNTGTGRPFRETDPLGGSDHYSASKAAAEHVATSYQKAARSGVAHSATVRAGNVIGGGDWARDRLLPDLMRSAEGPPAQIRNPTAVRPWQHVLDCLHGYMMLTEALWEEQKYEGAWNFGPNEAGLTAAGVADEAVALWPDAIRWERDEADHHPAEAPTLSLDSTKARHELGWRPLIPVHSALAWTVDWYRRVAQGEDALSVVNEQLGRYEELVAGMAAQ